MAREWQSGRIAGGDLCGQLQAWPFMAEADIPTRSFKTVYITSYFCGSKYMVAYKAVK